jgi:hypothetical protein
VCIQPSKLIRDVADTTYLSINTTESYAGIEFCTGGAYGSHSDVTGTGEKSSKNEIEVCKWGAGVAGSAQQSKLSGLTLYSAKNNLKKRTYSKPWMPKMALGITEQTYKSKSRLKPAAVKNTYYQGCVKHELAKK